MTRKSTINGEPEFKRIEFFLAGFIIANLIAFSIESGLAEDSKWLPALRVFEVISVILFSIEYIARAALTRPSRRYIFSFMGLIDLVAILPFLLGGFLDLRALRALRLLRLFRILKIVRYIRALDRFRIAFHSIREELVVAACGAGIILFLASIGIYYFEKDAQPENFGSVFHCMWWATATLTTVGYGDVYPVTAGGRIFTFFVLLIGLGIVAVPTALFATAMTNARKIENRLNKKKSPPKDDESDSHDA